MNLILNLVSIVAGLMSLIFLVPGLIPALGWIQYMTLAIAGFGALIGSFAEKKIGMTFNLVVLVIAGVRLFAGGGCI